MRVRFLEEIGEVADACLLGCRLSQLLRGRARKTQPWYARYAATDDVRVRGRRWHGHGRQCLLMIEMPSGKPSIRLPAATLRPHERVTLLSVLSGPRTRFAGIMMASLGYPAISTRPGSGTERVGGAVRVPAFCQTGPGISRARAAANVSVMVGPSCRRAVVGGSPAGAVVPCARTRAPRHRTRIGTTVGVRAGAPLFTWITSTSSTRSARTEGVNSKSYVVPGATCSSAGTEALCSADRSAP